MSNQPSPEVLDEATIDLIFILRDSLTDDGPSRLDFWNGRATSALAAAAAGADNIGQAVTIASRKLQIEVLTAAASKRMKKVAEIISQDYDAWASHVDKNLVYIVALAKCENTTRKTEAAEKRAATQLAEEPQF